MATKKTKENRLLSFIEKVEPGFSVVIVVLFVMTIILGLIPIFNTINSHNPIHAIFCYGQVEEDIEELYYFKHYKSNLSGSNAYNCKIGNHTIDKLRQEEYNTARSLEAQRRECSLSGKDYNEIFDLIQDYNLSCERIKYINDHYVTSAEKRDGGYIKGVSSGFFSSGNVKGKFYSWVQTENLATGRLVKEVDSHLNCNGIVDSKVFTYYTESDFIMYYVNNCVDQNGR